MQNAVAAPELILWRLCRGDSIVVAKLQPALAGAQLQVMLDEDVLFTCVVPGSMSRVELLELAAIARRTFERNGWAEDLDAGCAKTIAELTPPAIGGRARDENS